MDRREALKALAVATGGMVLVPSCNFSKEDILSAYSKLQITPTQVKLLAAVADAIIPAGSLKGSADLMVHDFILVMVNDCLKPEEQQKFISGLSSFDSYAILKAGKTF